MSLFNFGNPKPPLPLREKVWVETRLRRLGEWFGMDRIASGRVIEPEDLDGDDPFDGSPEAVRRLFARICEIMEVDPQCVTLEIAPQEDMDCAGKYYGKDSLIRVSDWTLESPIQLAATLAHELSHYILITKFGKNLLENDEDREWVTDLLPLVFGLGIFMANATIFKGYFKKWKRTFESRFGYLPSRMFSYAMALQIWLSDETDISWMRHLRDDASEVFYKSLQYIDATDDSLLRRDNINAPMPTYSIYQILDILDHGSDSERLVALDALAEGGYEVKRGVPLLIQLLNHSRPAIRAEAARRLATLGPEAKPALNALLYMADDDLPEIASAAIYALGCIHAKSEIALENLLFQMERPEVVETAAWALAQYGSAAEAALPKLEKALANAFMRNSKEVDFLLYAVHQIAPDAGEAIRRAIALCDEESHPLAEFILLNYSGEPFPPGACDWRYWLTGQT
jgi:hypothetical protein